VARHCSTLLASGVFTALFPYLACSFLTTHGGQIYVEVDADATACYMFFQRLACKAELVANVVGSANGLPESLAGNVSESLVGVCEASHHTLTYWFNLTTSDG
jgi:hypothetical protein